jgi:transcriptional regulator with XRE-family HTH domain
MQREALGKRIREARKQKALTQQQLAEALGITDVYVSESSAETKCRVFRYLSPLLKHLIFRLITF